MRRSERPVIRFAFLEDDGNRKRADRRETKLEKATGGEKMRGSGCVAGRKGDLNAPGISIPYAVKLESKTTRHASFGLKLATLRKIEEEAISAGKVGAMVVTFEDREDYIVIRRDYVEFGE